MSDAPLGATHSAAGHGSWNGSPLTRRLEAIGVPDVVSAACAELAASGIPADALGAE